MGSRFGGWIARNRYASAVTGRRGNELLVERWKGMSDASLVAVLQIVAAALLLAEIFLPSGGLLGLATAGVLIGSLWVAFGHSAALGGSREAPTS